MRNILLTFSDSYIENAKAMLSSIYTHSKNIRLILYIINASEENRKSLEEEFELLRALRNDILIEENYIFKDLDESINKRHKTKEYSELMAYSANLRFLVIYKLLKSRELLDLIYLDTDSILNKDIELFYEDVKGYDIAFRLREGASKTKGALSGVLYFKNSDKILEFTKTLKKEVSKAGVLKWYSDQIALRGTFYKNREFVNHYQLLDKHIDWMLNDDSIIWVGKGAFKDFEKYVEVKGCYLEKYQELIKE